MTFSADDMADYNNMRDTQVQKILWFAEEEYNRRYTHGVAMYEKPEKREHIEHVIKTRGDHLNNTYAKNKSLALVDWNDLDLIQSYEVAEQIDKISAYEDEDFDEIGVIHELFCDSLAIPVLKSQQLLESAEEAKGRIKLLMNEYRYNKELAKDLHKLQKMASFCGHMNVTTMKHAHLSLYRWPKFC